VAKDRSLEGTARMAESTQPRTEVRIKWDDSNMRNLYANGVNARGTREEIVLLFGMNQAWHASQKEVTPRRLATLLNNVIRDYEFRFGSLNIESGRPDNITIH
jgi:hypothetical protein